MARIDSPELKAAPGRNLGRYFVVAYGVSWGGVLLSVLLLPEAYRMDAMLLAMLAGPPVAALLSAPPDQRVRLLTTGWGGARWPWLLAGFTLAPAALLAVLLPMSLADPVFLPGFRPMLLLLGFVPALCEEIGWTGYATPRLLDRMTTARAGLLLGVLWACWHAAADLAGNVSAMGAFWPLQFLVFWILTLVPYRLLMTRAFARTRSRALAVAMHAGYTGGLLALIPDMDPLAALTWQAPFAALLWALAVLVPVNRDG